MNDSNYGFTWSLANAVDVKVTRLAILPGDRRALEVAAGKRKLEIYITRTGRIRVWDYRGEWRPLA